MYRLHIDVPCGTDYEKAKQITEYVTSKLKDHNLESINYRLGHDEDRKNRNHLILTEDGHASTKKCQIK